MKFTKYNNPNKKKRKKNLSYSDRSINAIKEKMIDKKLGYEISDEYYKEKYKL